MAARGAAGMPKLRLSEYQKKANAELAGMRRQNREKRAAARLKLTPGVEIRQRTVAGKFVTAVREFKPASRQLRAISQTVIRQQVAQLQRDNPGKQFEVAVKVNGIWYESRWQADLEQGQDIQFTEYGKIEIRDGAPIEDVRYYLRTPPAGGYDARRSNNCLLECIEIWAKKCGLKAPFGDKSWRFARVKEGLGLGANDAIPLQMLPAVESAAGYRIVVIGQYAGRAGAPPNEPACAVELSGGHYSLAQTTWCHDTKYGDATLSSWRVPVFIKQLDKNNWLAASYAQGADYESRTAAALGEVVVRTVQHGALVVWRRNKTFVILRSTASGDPAAELAELAAAREEMWKASGGRVDLFVAGRSSRLALLSWQFNNPFEIVAWPAEQQMILRDAMNAATMFASRDESSFSGAKLDVNACYPSILARTTNAGYVPVRPGEFVERDLPEKFDSYSCDIWHVFIHGAEEWRQLNKNGRYAEFELAQFQRAGLTFTQQSRQVLHFPRDSLICCGKSFGKFVEFWRSIELRAKELGLKRASFEAKMVRTQIWGALAQKEQKRRTLFHRDIILEDEMVETIKPSNDGSVEVELRSVRKPLFRGCWPALGVMTLARARVMLSSHIQRAEAAGFPLRRAHTDSLLVECTPERFPELETLLGPFDGTKLGGLKLESTGLYSVRHGKFLPDRETHLGEWPSQS
jgi:hypothetical protein